MANGLISQHQFDCMGHRVRAMYVYKLAHELTFEQIATQYGLRGYEVQALCNNGADYYDVSLEVR